MKQVFRFALAFLAIVGFACMATVAFAASDSNNEDLLWMKVRAHDKFERTEIASAGASIEMTREDYVMVLGKEKQRALFEKQGILEQTTLATSELLDFPTKDANFHNYAELKAELEALVKANPKIAALDSIGKSGEGRELLRIRISGDLKTADQKAGLLMMGGHHAREHVSIDIPLMFAGYLLKEYAAGNAEIVRLVDNRDIQIVPMVNPDGAEHDISTGKYKMWRKNRAHNHDGTYGVDLNRNYGYGWGTGGSSEDPSDETYMGPAPFSEPETQAVKRWADNSPNATVLLSLHTYSELILYPWGGSTSKIADAKDRSVFEKMAGQMAKWNGYTPEQSSDLYVASGDTCDWAYAEHKMFSFTFELDPSSMWDGGFYPGQAVLPNVFQKNLKPFLYLIDAAENPYKTIASPAETYDNAVIR